MNKLSAVSVGLLSLAISGAVGANAHKDTVYHCGCSPDGSELVWSEKFVNKNAGGHAEHSYSEDCYVGSSLIGTYNRGYDDCEEAGLPDVRDVDQCESASGYDFGRDGDSFNVGDNCEEE
jgi:hypothetical protein